MFSVYGVTGQVFSGTLEAMDRVHRLSRVRRARAIAQDGEELGVEAVAAHPAHEAVRAYRAMLSEDIEADLHAEMQSLRAEIRNLQVALTIDSWKETNR